MKKTTKLLSTLAMVGVLTISGGIVSNASEIQQDEPIRKETRKEMYQEKKEHFKKTRVHIVDLYAELSGSTVEEIKQECKETETNIFKLAQEANLLEEFKQSIIETKTENINELVEAGKIKEEKGLEIIQEMKERITNLDPDNMPEKPKKVHPKKIARNNVLDMYSKLSGNTVEEIRIQCKENKTNVFKLAKEADLLEQLKATIIETKTEKLNELIEAGKMTEEKSESIIQEMKERITNLDPDNMPERSEHKVKLIKKNII